MPVYEPSGAEHGATGNAAREMGTGPADQTIKTGRFLEKVLYKSEKPDKIFSVDGTGRNTTGNPETKRLTIKLTRFSSGKPRNRGQWVTIH